MRALFLLTAVACGGLLALGSHAAPVVGAVATGLNGLALGAFWWDKQQAQASRGRISEGTLHVLCLSGSAGACLGRLLFRHKTRKAAFTLTSGVGAGLLWYCARVS